MAQTWKYAIGLGLLGGVVAMGCTVTTGGDGVPSAGEAGEAGTGGTTGGSSGKGGTTGGSSGKGGTTGGSSGKGGTTGGSAGKGGDAGSGGAMGGSAGTATAGTGGMAGMPTEDPPECDPASGNLENTPFPDCEPTDPPTLRSQTCEECVQTSCCDESKACFSFGPNNVCGWGGPDEDDEYSGAGEIGCYVNCLADYVDENGFCDEVGLGECTGRCQTTMCGTVLGTQTSELATCIHENCSEDCFGTDTCE